MNQELCWYNNYNLKLDLIDQPKMKDYINYLNTFLGVPVKYISNGPGKNQIVSA